MIAAFSFKPAWCAECGERFQPHKSTERFCSCDCRKTYHNRRISGGLKLYDLAMLWRIERPDDAWHNLTQLADQLATEERIRRAKRRERIANQKAEMKSERKVA